MTVRRFGPILGAGVSVEEKEGDKQIQAAPLGVTVLIGEYEKGEVNVPAFLSGVKDFARRNGGRLQNHDTPLCAQDFYSLGRGKGELITHRVTAGDEVRSRVTLRTRQGVTAFGRAATSKAFVLGNVIGPWAFPATGSKTLIGAVDRNGNQTLTITATGANITNGVDENFALTNGQTLTLKVDRGTEQSIEFLTAEFVSIGAATAEEVCAVINAKLAGGHADLAGTNNRIKVVSDTLGLNSYVEITGGTANTALQFSAASEQRGTGNVNDLSAVTASELKTLIEAAWTNGSGCTVTYPGGVLRIETNVAGDDGYIQVISSSTLDTILGLDNTEHQGSDGVSAIASGRKVLGKLYAKNGGRWGGQRKYHLDEITGSGDLTATTIDTGDAMIENEWAGGTLQLKKVTARTYRITGNTAAGVISVAGDQDLLTDWTAGIGTPANRYLLTRANTDYLGNNKHLAVEIGKGSENPSTEFSLKVYVDGAPVGSGYDNLSTDSTKTNYWVNVINRDPGNRELFAEDLYTGDKTVAAVQPANFYGLSKTLTSLTLTLPDPDVTIDSPTEANPDVAITLGSAVKRQILTGTVSNAGADITWTTDLGTLSVLKASFSGSACNLGDEIGTVTVTNGGTVLANGDVITIEILALEVNEAIGGTVWPSVVAKPKLGFQIVSNTRTTVSVRTGMDLTDSGTISAGAPFMLAWKEQLSLGADSAPVDDADYLLALDPNLSPLRRIFGKNKGLVKVSTPGTTSATVQRAAIEFCAAMNWAYKVQIPANVVTEADAIEYINTTIGRSDYASNHWPSFGSVEDPDAVPNSGVLPLKQQSLIGMILGREALVANQYLGYHKAPAGIDVTLPAVLELPLGNPETMQPINEEQTNPAGINLVKFKNGNCILWGDRTIAPTSEWKWYHQRCQMSHYEQMIMENFDWIVWAINNSEAWQSVRTSLLAYFYPEWTKGALYGKTLDEAVQLKIDDEVNTDLTMADGDLIGEISLKLANTVERFRARVSKAGIFDAVK